MAVAGCTAVVGNNTISDGSYFAVNDTYSNLYVYKIINNTFVQTYSLNTIFVDVIRFGYGNYLYVLDRTYQKINKIDLSAITRSLLTLGNSYHQMVNMDIDNNIVLLVKTDSMLLSGTFYYLSNTATFIK